MSKIAILTDSSCDIPQELAEKYGIDIMGFHILLDDVDYVERESCTNAEFYEKMRAAKGIPSTAAITPLQFCEKYCQYVDEGYTDVIHVPINRSGSSTYNNAVMAQGMLREERPEHHLKIHLLDPHTYSMPFGWYVCEMARKLKNGAEISHVIHEFEAQMDKIEIVLGPFSLKQMKKSGRISAAAAVMGELMGIRPIITLIDGKTKVEAKVRGDDKVVPAMVELAKKRSEGVEPSEIIKDYGADIIRLWVASSDYTVDVRAGKNIFKQLSEAYRKIRNTARFILGNLDGFDPNTDCVTDDQLQEIDRWALAALDDLIVNAHAGYEVYDFNKVYHAVYNFCVVAMSNFYLDVTKDRLYCTNGAARRAAQTTMYKILVALDKIIAPILCFTSQEIWDFMPKTEGMNKYVVFEDMPKAGQYAADDAFKAKWAQLIAVRDEVKKVLEQARAEKTIGASLEAAVTLYCNDAVYDLLNSIPMDELADLMIVSHVELVKGEGGAASAVEGLGVAAAHATGDKCERCWKYSASIGSHPAHPTLCARCASVVEA